MLTMLKKFEILLAVSIAMIIIITKSLAKGGLTTKYNFGEEREFCETEVFEAACPPGYVILMLAASYGRMRVDGRCVVRDYGYIGCRADVLDLADAWCSGRRRCQIVAPNAQLKKRQPCPRDLTPYLAVSYTCLEVEGADKTCPEKGGVVNPSRKAIGYLSSGISIERDVGSVNCPWLLQIQQGQEISITLMDFSGVTRTPSSSSIQSSSGLNEYQCNVYATIRDKTKAKEVTVCGNIERNKTVYTSANASFIEVDLSGSRTNADESFEHFLLRYEVTGCPDPVISSGYWMKRTNKHQVTIHCSAGDPAWTLSCNDTSLDWEGGPVGNCSESESPTPGLFGWGSVVLSFEASLLVIAAGTVALGAILVLMFLCCYRRLNRRTISSGKNLASATSQKERPVKTVLPQRISVGGGGTRVVHISRERSDTEFCSEGNSQPKGASQLPLSSFTINHSSRTSSFDKGSAAATECEYFIPPPPSPPKSGDPLQHQWPLGQRENVVNFNGTPNFSGDINSYKRKQQFQLQSSNVQRGLDSLNRGSNGQFQHQKSDVINSNSTIPITNANTELRCEKCHL